MLIKIIDDSTLFLDSQHMMSCLLYDCADLRFAPSVWQVSTWDYLLSTIDTLWHHQQSEHHTLAVVETGGSDVLGALTSDTSLGQKFR